MFKSIGNRHPYRAKPTDFSKTGHSGVDGRPAARDLCRRGECNPKYSRSLERGVSCSLTASTFASSRSGHRDIGMREVVTNKQQRLSKSP